MNIETEVKETSRICDNALPPQKPLNTDEEQYRHVRRGDGGTFTIDRGIRRIGTSGCDYSVGAYFQIETKRSFCAHMALETSIESITEEQGRRIQRLVRKRLHEIRKRDNWDIEDEHLGSYMTLVCRHPTHTSKGQRLRDEGWHIVEGVRKFMQDCADELNPIADEAQRVAWEAIGAIGPKEFDPYPGKHVNALEMRAHALTTGVVYLEDRVIPAMTAITDGKGFVIDNADSFQSRVLRLDGDEHGVNFHTGDADRCKWVAKEEKKGQRDWLFSLD